MKLNAKSRLLATKAKNLKKFKLLTKVALATANRMQEEEEVEVLPKLGGTEEYIAQSFDDAVLQQLEDSLKDKQLLADALNGKAKKNKDLAAFIQVASQGTLNDIV